MRLLILFVACILSIFTALAQAPTFKHWDSSFGGNGEDWLIAFKQTTDGGFIMGGATGSGNGGDITDPSRGMNDFWIIKIDSSGNKQWDRRLGGDSTEYLSSIIQTTDGGYLASGTSYSDSTGDVSHHSKGVCDYWVVKLSANGTKLWDKKFGGTIGTANLFSAAQTYDGGYVLAGSVLDWHGDISGTNPAHDDIWVIKTDSLGNKQWDNLYVGIDLENSVWSIYQTADSGYIFGAETNSDNSQVGGVTQPCIGGNCYNDYWVVKISSTGVKQWDRRYGGFDDDYFGALVPANDGGYLVGGYTMSDNTGDITDSIIGGFVGAMDIWIVKLNAQHQKVWNRRIGSSGAEYLTSMVQTHDGGYLISSGSEGTGIDGDKTEANLGIGQTWIIKTDSNGIILWDKTLFTNSFVAPYNGNGDFGRALEVSDGCYVIASMTNADTGGYKTQPARGGRDIWVIKMCTTPPIICNAYFTIFPDSAQGFYYGFNQSFGTGLSYLWNFGDGDTSTLPYPMHNYSQPGHYNICLTVDDGAGCVHTYCDSSFYVFKTDGGLMSQLIIRQPALAIEETKPNLNVRLYPNPATDELFIEAGKQVVNQVSIYNTTGNLMSESKQPLHNRIATNTLSSGIYIAEIKGNDWVVRKRWVKM